MSVFRLFVANSHEELEAVSERFSVLAVDYTLLGNRQVSRKWVWDAGEEIADALFCDGVNRASASVEAEVLTLFQGEGEKCLSDFQDTDLASICQGGKQSSCSLFSSN